MIKLSQALEGERVRILNKKGETFEGAVTDYIYPEDNDPEIGCICIRDCPQRPGQWIGFNEDNILSIEIVD